MDPSVNVICCFITSPGQAAPSSVESSVDAAAGVVVAAGAVPAVA